jgi:hypothetical protein
MPQKNESKRFPMFGGPTLDMALGKEIHLMYRDNGGTRTLEQVIAQGGFRWSEVEAIYATFCQKHGKPKGVFFDREL